MQGSNQYTLDVIEAFQQAESQEALWQCFHEKMEKLSIKEANYVFGSFGVMLDLRHFIDQAYIRTSFPQAYVDDKENGGYYDNDYYWEMPLTTTTPLLWRDEGAVDQITPLQRESLDIDWDHNLITGVTLPTRFNNGLGRGAIGLHAKGLTWEEFDQVWAEKGDVIQDVFTAFDICMREDHMGEIYPLSLRERECLLWLAAGLRPQQIADRLNTHPKTVEKQIASARLKLKADTVAQAVAKSLIFGLITP